MAVGASIAIKEFRNNEITIHLDNDKDALLVLAEVLPRVGKRRSTV